MSRPETPECMQLSQNEKKGNKTESVHSQLLLKYVEKPRFLIIQINNQNSYILS